MGFLDRIKLRDLLLALALTLLVGVAYPLFTNDKVISGFSTLDKVAADTGFGSDDTVAKQKAVEKLIDSNQEQNFQLEIPRLGISRRVVENVDPASESAYGPVLQNYIAHGKYTRLPDEATIDGNVYLFAHRDGSAQGRDIGYFRRLDELQDGDVAIIRYGNKEYKYTFFKKFVITPEDTWVYTGNNPIPTLTLQTCENGEELRLMAKFKLVSVQAV